MYVNSDDIYFNSIKVRLEPSSTPLKAAEEGFQFHKGTIRTILKVPLNIKISLFQFHKGTIRTLRKFKTVGIK